MENHRDIIQSYYAQYQNMKSIHKNNQLQSTFSANQSHSPLKSPSSFQKAENQENQMKNQSQNIIKHKSDNKKKYKLRVQQENNDQNTYKQKYQKILNIIKCNNYQQAQQKMHRINENEKFVKRLKEMIGMCEKIDENQISLSKCWKFIKAVVQQSYKQKKSFDIEGSIVSRKHNL